MKIYIFDVAFSKIPEKGHPATQGENSLVITPHNKNVFKLGTNNFMISKVTPNNEPMNTEKVIELSVCKNLEVAKRFAKLFVEEENKTFIHN